jgi:hypothetical protein
MATIVVTAMTLASSSTGAQVSSRAESASKITVFKPPKAPVDNFMGEYEGTFTAAKGSPMKAEAKVFPQGKGLYRAALSTLPEGGARAMEMQLDGRLRSKALALFLGQRLQFGGSVNKVVWSGTIVEGKLVAEAKGGDGGKFVLSRIERKSPTEGLKPPAGAVVLFPFEPGKPTSLDEWTNKNWKIMSDGSVEVAKGRNLTLRQFGDVQLHVEFMCPYEPLGRGQGRGNSGVYLQNYYELQVLDSFGLPPKNNECGGVYSIAAPKVNACLPPLRWQTYDITFRAPRFGADGKVEKPPTITVIHNGVKIHDELPIPRGTEKRGPGGEVKIGPIQLQDHSHAVRYRNMWVVELKD